MSDTANKGTSSITAIDQAIAAAQARKAARNGEPAPTGTPAEKAPRVKLSDEEKAQREERRNSERDAKKVQREEARAAKKAERDNGKRTPHMSKVEKAAERLPALNDAASVLFTDITTNLTRDQITAIAAHLTHFNRVQATSNALGRTVEAGMLVNIASGDPRYIGKQGTVVKSQRIRCYVNIPGENNRPIGGSNETGIYFFTSDVEPVSIKAEELESKAS